jgi:tryptophan-rich sensory protein
MKIRIIIALVVVFPLLISTLIVWKKGLHDRLVRDALGMFAIQIIFTIIWFVLFFKIYDLRLAFFEICLLFIIALITLILFSKLSRVAGVFLIPYLICVGLVGYYNYSLWQIPEAAPSNYKGVMYTIDNERYLGGYFGNSVTADFNHDGFQDYAFLVTQDGGGSGTFYYVVAALGSKEGYQGTNAIFLGDRIAPQTTEWKNETIIVNYADRKPDEPMTALPTVGASKYLVIKDKILEEVTR